MPWKFYKKANNTRLDSYLICSEQVKKTVLGTEPGRKKIKKLVRRIKSIVE